MQKCVRRWASQSGDQPPPCEATRVPGQRQTVTEGQVPMFWKMTSLAAAGACLGSWVRKPHLLEGPWQRWLMELARDKGLLVFFIFI